MKKRNISSTILIVVGVMVFSYPFVIQGYTKYQQKQLVNEYEQILLENIHNQLNIQNHVNTQNQVTINPINSIEEASSNNELDNTSSADTNTIESIDQTEATYVDIKEILPQLEQVSKDSQNSKVKANEVNDFLRRQEILGMIEIEKINLKMIVVEGTEWENIRVTIGHMKQTVPMGDKGNCALAGHRGGTYGTFFKNINLLEVDDEIKLTDIKGKVYSYKVYEQFVTEATDMSVIENVLGEKTLTLISCEDSGTRRLIVRARQN